MGSAMMKRLALMQDWPLLRMRDFHGRGDGFVEIRARHHDEGVAAAEFQHDFLHALGRAHSDVDSGAFAAGERGGGDARIVENGVDLGRADQKRLEHALGKARTPVKIFDHQTRIAARWKHA